nr:unnamed protein product [Digitaria exilis]
MASLQLPSLAASVGLFLLSVLAVALLAVTLYILGVVASFAVFCIREFARRDQDRPPLIGTVFRQLRNFDSLFDEHVRYALAHRTSRLVFPGHSEFNTADPAVIEHVLKTSFSKYSRGAFNYSVMKDLFGDGIFATDGEKWRHQRKLASHEFSTKVLREFSSVVFRTNATKLAEKISSAANNGTSIDMQDGKMADEDDVLPNGYRVMKGDGMNYTICAMGRMTYLWGEDAEDFKPERWLANGVFQQESPYKFASFNLRNFDRLFDGHVRDALAHRTCRLVYPRHSEVNTVDPAVIEHVLKTSFSKYSKGSFSYSIMKDLFGDGIFATDGEKWRHQRKLASHEFSTKVLRAFSSVVFRTNATKLADKISSAANNGTVIDMQDLLMKTTMDSIFKVGFGFELNTLSGSDESSIQFSNAFDEANSLVFHRYVDIFWQLKRYFNIGSEAKLRRNIQIIDDFRAREDILSRFIMQSKTDPKTMNDRYLRDIVLNFLIAGKDTTGNTLTWFFYMLCKNPIVQNKVELEINESVQWAEKDSADDFTARLNEGAIEKMHYLHAAISETLRLYPAVPVDGKMADEDDILPNGYRVMKGDGVYYTIYAMGRMTYLWGEDAEDFKPERWLVNGVFQQESPYKFVSFNVSIIGNSHITDPY